LCFQCATQSGRLLQSRRKAFLPPAIESGVIPERLARGSEKTVSRFNHCRGSGVFAAGQSVVSVPTIFARYLFDRILALRSQLTDANVSANTIVQ